MATTLIFTGNATKHDTIFLELEIETLNINDVWFQQEGTTCIGRFFIQKLKRPPTYGSPLILLKSQSVISFHSIFEGILVY